MCRNRMCKNPIELSFQKRKRERRESEVQKKEKIIFDIFKYIIFIYSSSTLSSAMPDNIVIL